MKAKEIQELIDFIAQSGLDEVNIETDQFKLNVKRNSLAQARVAEPIASQPALTAPVAISAPQIAPPAVTTPTTASSASKESDSKYVTVKSPMIGTFYRAANPESPVLANVGDDIKKGQPVCIIEAMKLFNEIESEVSGKIVKVLVENASPVEYDQPLFLVDPS